MAITPPGAGELARLRDLVGGSTPLAPASTGPSTPLADPTGGVQPTPLAPAAGPPMFKSSLLQQIPEEPSRPEEIGLEPEMEEVIDPEEQERRKWALLETPPELIPKRGEALVRRFSRRPDREHRKRGGSHTGHKARGLFSYRRRPV